MKKLIAIHEIQVGRDGKLLTVAPRTEFEFSADEAKYLIEAGAAKAVAESDTAGSPKPARTRKAAASE